MTFFNSSVRHRSVAVLAVAASMGLGAAEPDVTSEQAVGYYPTYQESGLISSGTYDYERSVGGPVGGPDLDRLAATGGIWPYEYSAGQLSRLQRFMQPVDYILRPLTPGETIALQGPTSESWFQIGGAFPFLTRTYHTEKSSFADLFGMEATQYSPFFFDILNISAYGIYVDQSGVGNEAEAERLDGSFYSALSMSFRVGWGLTDRTSIVVGGQIFLILTDETDFRFYADAGGLGALVSFNYQVELGGWDLRVFDNLTPISQRLLSFDESYKGDLSWGGSNWIGIPQDISSGDWWDSDAYLLVNTAGLTAGTFVGDSLRFLAGFSRIDTMRFNDLGDGEGSEIASAGLFYDGYDLWIAPSLTYTLYTHDFENPQHLVMLNGVAPLSPNITAHAGVGYSWGDSYDGMNWSVSVNYLQTARLTHQFSYQSGYQNAITGEDLIGTRIDYGVQYQLGPRLTLGGYAGWFDSDDGTEAIHIGGSVNLALGNYSWLRIVGGYLDRSGGSSGLDFNEYFYNVTLSRRLAERLEGQLSYEFIKSEGIGNRDRSIMMLRLTRTF